MRFVGAENRSINSITLVHKCNELKFRCIIEPLPFSSNSIQELDLPNDMTIIFNDTYEVEALINMLTKMRETCNGYMGYWDIDNK